MVWSDTGVQVSVNGYFENNSFQLMIHNPAGGTDEVNLAHAYVGSDSLIESVHRANSTVGIVWGTELPDSTLYGLDEPIYTDGMKDCEVIFVDNEFLSAAVPSFNTRRRNSSFKAIYRLCTPIVWSHLNNQLNP
jgi:hypothetical protein